MKLLDRGFERIGGAVARRPWTSLFLSAVFFFILAAGFPLLESESRPEKQWVPRGAISLDQKDYVDRNFASSLRFGSFLATCKQEGEEGEEGVEGKDCNLLEAKYIQRLQLIVDRLNAVSVDADALLAKDPVLSAADLGDQWEALSGNWSYRGDAFSQAKCFQTGAGCLTDFLPNSVLSIFADQPQLLAEATDAMVANALTNWEKAEVLCPLSVANPSSPCVNATAYNPRAGPDDCSATGLSMSQRMACVEAMVLYCAAECTPTSCRDPACRRSGWFVGLMGTSFIENPQPALNAPRDLGDLISSGADGPAKNVDGSVRSARALMVTMFMAETTIVYNGIEEDPVSDELEKMMLCVLGTVADSKDPSPGGMACEEDDLLQLTGFFSRSLGDEFGGLITGDVPKLGTAFILVLAYMIIMLSPWDSVHAMSGLGLTTLFIVLMSYVGCCGIGGYVGLLNNTLNMNIPFLLLGLGVDDAFVLVSEYTRYFRAHPDSTPEERVVAAARHGGVSILITSLTDMLAFLIGSATRLPALSWFCQFAGIGVGLCFVFQLTVFLPAMLINARRADANRRDFLCCCKVKAKHEFGKLRPARLESFFRVFGQKISRGAPRAVTFAVFFGITTAGVVGASRAYKDFKIEYFIPDDSYVSDFNNLNDRYFATGTNFAVYTQEMDYAAHQGQMMEIYDVLVDSPHVDHTSEPAHWHRQYIEYLTGGSHSVLLSPDGTAVLNASDYYHHLFEWFQGGPDGLAFEGRAMRENVNWVDAACDGANSSAFCDVGLGIRGSRIRASLTTATSETGTTRFTALSDLREQLRIVTPGLAAVKSPFPYSRQFLFWEEVGIIDYELTSNLLIAGAVVAVIIFGMIQIPRIAFFVVLAIILSIVDLVGYLYWWDVSISGVSTIYILISVGLAVDYSAHIAHVFVLSEGSAEDRVAAAMERIGPSVFNGVMSTMMAVLALSTSGSYVFRVFFKALCLIVLLGGAHGLWLLPAFLSVFGGDNHPKIDHEPVPTLDDKELDDLGPEPGDDLGPEPRQSESLEC